ncbi:alkaline phosphatase [Parvularcula sp. LCG005]|uniref:alkaline phosphatase n=1 Tax=Parvularcula sp. LCG005 TaxID=3078805 RepID=UPI002943BB0B|nr:alkaline phosphatase [Parvularcula sp. LCG005]WOI52344.1 alkaline phosphatase [Parvularcula sp. LCG005]
MISLLLSAALVVQPAPAKPVDWVAVGEQTLAQRKAVKPIDHGAKNVILFVADGMDITTITAGRILAGQLQGKSGEEHVLAFETMPHVALSKTYNVNMQTADSAGTATAMMTGRKTKAGVIDVDQTVPRGDCEASVGKESPSIMDFAAAQDRSVGVVSTARITHATPATVYAHAADRDWESDTDLPRGATCKDIAAQLIDATASLPLKVVLGGGRRNFMPAEMPDPEYEGRSGGRADGRDLTNEFLTQSDANAYVWNAEQLSDLDHDKVNAVLGLFEPSHMQYDADREKDKGGEPSLAELTGFAIDHLSKDEDGFFLLVEGGRVDHAHHAGNAARALNDVVAFDAAVAMALEKTSAEDTLIIVTADHGHTLALQGYPKRGNPILGTVVSVGSKGEPLDTPLAAGDGQPYTTLSYSNGPGSVFAKPSKDVAPTRPFVSMEEAQDIDYQQQSLIPAASESHGGQDVSIYARGPMAHLMGGVVEQSYIYYVMREAFQPTEADTQE